MPEIENLQPLLVHWNLPEPELIKPFGGGLINHTWLVEKNGVRFILQQINQQVFRNPPQIAENIQRIGQYLKEKQPDYFFVEPVKTTGGLELVQYQNEWFRLFPFVKDSHTLAVAETPQQAFAAAQQFGRFTALLKDFPAKTLHITLENFHNLTLRFAQFEEALPNAKPERLTVAREAIDKAQEHAGIAHTYRIFHEQNGFRKRVTHHDTKISNVLLNERGEGLCVIDLDTVMPGYFISDFGDMLRTYLSPVSEEEKDFSKIAVRDDFYHAIKEGYLSEMGSVLTEVEQDYLFYAGQFMTYMQALRFLTDYLNNDVYYGSAYEQHNLIRAGNQFRLLECLLEKKYLQ